jgi:hypothetical protein
VKQIQAQFMAMDKDRSGMISLQELKTSLQQSAQKFTDDELAQLLRDLDLAAEGAINYLEFVAAAISLHQLHEEHTAEFSALARAAFDKFDIDHKGYVDLPLVSHLHHRPIHRSYAVEGGWFGWAAAGEEDTHFAAPGGKCVMGPVLIHFITRDICMDPHTQVLHRGAFEARAADHAQVLRAGWGGDGRSGG